MKRLAAGSLIVAFVLASTLQAEPPVMQSCAPLGILSATTTTVSFVGAFLGDSPQLWTSFPLAEPAVLVVNPDPKAKPDRSRAAFRIHPATSVVPGIYGTRIATPGGVTGLRLIMVDDLPRLSEVSTNKSPDKAMKLTPPVAVDAGYEQETFDYYTFPAKAGQELAIEVVARRLGTPLDAVMRLLDAKGRELAFSDDDEAIGADPRLTYRFETAGDYVVEIRDIRYQGSAGSRYRLRIGEKLLPSTSKVDDGQPVAQETEPNNDAEHATKPATASALVGVFGEPRDRDFYRFQLKKGDAIRFVGRTRGLGSPTDLYMQLLSGDGKKMIAETDDAGVEEGTLETTATADGDYLLAVEDLVGRGGPTFTYRIDVDLNRPRLSASIDADKYDVPKAGIAQAKINVVRNGFDGPVTFRLEGSKDVKFIGAAGAGKADINATLFVPSTLAPGTPMNVRLFAEATVNGKTLSVPVRTIASLRKSLSGLPNPPAALDGIVALGLGEPSASNFKLTTKTSEVVYDVSGTKAEVVVAVDRQKEQKDAVVTLAAYGLPEGYSAKPVDIVKGKDEATLVVTGPKTSPPLTKPFVVVGTTVVAKKTHQTSLDGLTLYVGTKPKKEASTVAVADAKPQAKATAAEKGSSVQAATKPAAKPKQPTKVEP